MNREMKNIAIIFAGGIGQRMGSNIPKQFLEVYGKPILIHTLEKFQLHDEVDLIYVGCKEEYIPYFKELVEKYHIDKIPENGIIPGGSSGQDTIYRILKQARKYNQDDSIVLIHDGVRPIITDEVISRNIESVKQFGSAITCTPCFETPIVSYDGKRVAETPARSNVYTAQAPQSFFLGDILAVHEKVREYDPNYEGEGIVDSCTLVTTAGGEVNIIEGNRGNIKVTTPEDYIDLLARLSAEDQKKIFSLMTSSELEKEKMKNMQITKRYK